MRRFLILLAFASMAANAVAQPSSSGLARAGSAASPTAPGGVPSPESFLGHAVGEDRRLAPYPKVLEYLDLVASASDRVSIEEAGTSTDGQRMPIVVLTSAANQGRLERYRQIARSLARPDLAPVASKAELESLLDEGRAIALVTCTIHSTEVGCTQMAMEFIHDVATTSDAEQLGWLDEVIVLLMPSINPDGQILVVDWYEKYLGTPFEGGQMPWLYQRYVGHDNNRDFYMLTQKETRVVNQVLYHRWFPQVFLDEHQMGSTGPRMFVPPQTDPLDPEVHSLVFRQADLLGTNMSYRLEESGKRGVGHDMIFDSYWPGGTRNTAWWKNVTGLLTEVASARIATPIHIDPSELRGGGKGFPEYGRRANYPSPWPGGWWRLRDIVDYERIATWALVETLAENRRDFLGNIRTMATEAITRGAQEEPYAWILPPGQHDAVAARRLIELLLEHGVEVQRAVTPVTVGAATYPVDTMVIPADQAYRPFLMTMLNPQRYPEVRQEVGGPIISPYDVTSWSLPLALGVDLVEAKSPLVGDRQAIAAPVESRLPIVEASGGFLVSHRDDSSTTLTNRLLDLDVAIYWLQEPTTHGEVGALWIPPGETELGTLQDLADELHLAVESLTVPPQSSGWRVHSPRVGLYKPWNASMDEGWTRFLFETYGFTLQSLSTQDVREGGFGRDLEVVVLPDVSPDVLAYGESQDPDDQRLRSQLPPPYTGGLDSSLDRSRLGSERLRGFVERGGTVVALDSACAYAIDVFELPLIDEFLSSNPVTAPGTSLRILVDTSQPLGFGLRPEEAAYFASSPGFRTSPTDARFERQVIARYPDNVADLLLSGYLDGGEQLERRPAMVDYRLGEGRVILIGFRAQHRAQTVRTFKLLFNSLYVGSLEAVSDVAADAGLPGAPSDAR
ncbi:MAG: hypothetical protein K8J08_00970 [Thermoanaerobaculia bacterium]|nr:hypothetical protein [Thermoanaerobaculia bacterium]